MHGSWCFYPSSHGASGPRMLIALVSLAAVLLHWRHPRQKKTVSHFKMFGLFLLILFLSFSRISNSGFLQPQSPKYIWNSLSKSKKHGQARHKASPRQEDEAKGTAARRVAPQALHSHLEDQVRALELVQYNKDYWLCPQKAAVI